MDNERRVRPPWDERLSRCFRALQPHLSMDAWFDLAQGEYRELLDHLEWQLPGLIQEVDRWFDSFDGVFNCSARLGPDEEIEIVGLPILISDQRLVAMQLRVQVFPDKDAIRWLELRVGEADQEGRMKKYDYHGKWPRMDLLKNAIHEISWVYHVEYGKREGRSGMALFIARKNSAERDAP